MEYYKEYLVLFLLVVAVVIAGPLIDAIRDFSAVTGAAAAGLDGNPRREGFAADRIPSGEYPREVDEPLLYPTYPKKGPGYGVVLRGNDSANNSKLYPVAANLGNYDQATNNVRDWVTPDNGSCRPAGMCGALYESKPTEEYNVPEPLPFDHPERRVGFYAAGSAASSL